MARVKSITVAKSEQMGLDLSIFPNFHKSGSIKGIKKIYYGQDALLLRCGNYIYKVTDEIYNLLS